MSEISTMYAEGDLWVTPEYQRLFRWSEAKQSQFIESLLLELPIPPIFVLEEDGRWELVDGLQRVQTYLRFRGQGALAPAAEDQLVGEPSGETESETPRAQPPVAASSAGVAGETESDSKGFALSDCDLAPELEGLTYDTLPTALQLQLRRSFLRVEILRANPKDPQWHYHIFKRLNTGGEPLSEQEIRNCTVLFLGEGGRRFNSFLYRLSRKPAFKVCIEYLSEPARDRMQDRELVLRFFAFLEYFENFVHDIGPFLTHYMEDQAPSFDDATAASKEVVFDAVFDILAKTLKADTCRAWSSSGTPTRGFSMHHFEAFTVGLARLAREIESCTTLDYGSIDAALRGVKSDAQFALLTTGGGKNSKNPYEAKISKVTEAVRPLLEREGGAPG